MRGVHLMASRPGQWGSWILRYYPAKPHTTTEWMWRLYAGEGARAQTVGRRRHRRIWTITYTLLHLRDISSIFI